MSKIILQPCGSGDAKNHYEDTIANRISLVRIQPFITTQEFNTLSIIYPSGDCLIWGVVPGNNDVNVTKWDSIGQGDITLFAGLNRIFASGVTTYKLHSPGLAEDLWEFDDKGQTWEYIYFLEEIRNLNIPYLEFNNAIGYQPRNIIRGFRVLTQDQSNLFLETFDLESDLIIEEVTPANFANLVNQLDDLEETDKLIQAKRRLEQGYLKNHLFRRSTIGTCACCHKEYPVSYLVTAHIKKRSECSDKEKRDLNVVMPMCKFGCDEIFEKGYIVVLEGQFKKTQKTPSSLALEDYISEIQNNACEYFNPKTESYFTWHYENHR